MVAFGHGFFMGAFLATLQVPAETLITILAEKGGEVLETAFLWSGALGVLSAGLYVAAQRRMRFNTLAIANAGLIMLTVAGFTAGVFVLRHRKDIFLVVCDAGSYYLYYVVDILGLFWSNF